MLANEKSVFAPDWDLSASDIWVHRSRHACSPTGFPRSFTIKIARRPWN
jgi:hypothetical protein